MSQSSHLLKIIATNKQWGADQKSLLTLYRVLIRSKLDYASFVYGSARKSYISKLEPITNQALRLCLGAFRTSYYQFTDTLSRTSVRTAT